MSNLKATKGTGQEQKKTPVPLPQQKIFRFMEGTAPQQIDNEVNAWLRERAEKKLGPPSFGKLEASEKHIYIVYYYIDLLEI